MATAGRSVIDYMLLPPSLAFHPQTGAMTCALRVEPAWAVPSTDHTLIWTALPCTEPVNRRREREQPRRVPNTKLLLEKDNALADKYRVQLAAYTPFYTQFTTFLSAQVAAGQVGAAQAAAVAKHALTAITQQVVAATIGYVTLRRQRQQRNWTPAVEAAVRAKRLAMAAHRASPGVDTEHELGVRRRAVKAALRAARVEQRAAADAGIVQAFDEGQKKGGKDAVTLFWRLYNKQYGAPVARVVDMLQSGKGGEMLVLPQDVADEFARHHAEVGSAARFAAGADFDEEHAAQVEDEVRGYMQASGSDEGLAQLNEKMRVSEVVAACKQLCNGKAPSPLDGVNNEMLKYGGGGMVRMLHTLFALQWGLEVHEQTPGVVKNLHKGGDRTCASNYRPITLLSCVDKLYHRVIANRVSSVLEAEGLLHEGQNAFRPARDCLQHALALHAAVSARQAAGQDTYVFFADQAKAYDSVWRAGMLHKLWAKGIRGRMYRVIANMYSSTVLCVGHQAAMSQPFTVDQGVAQGDTLSPILFDVFVDELLREVHESCASVPVPDADSGVSRNLTALMFADDFMGVAATAEDMQTMVNCVNAYFRRWRMKANVTKSAVMVVRGRRVGQGGRRGAAQLAADVEVTWGEVPVPVVSAYKYMGIMFHNSGKWDEHVKFVADKLKTRARMLGGVLKNKSMSVAVKRAVVLAVLRPRAEYGVAVWATAKAVKTKLNSMQMDVVKSAAGCPPTTSHAVLQLEWGIRPMGQWVDMRLLEMWHRVSDMDEERVVRQLAFAKPEKVGKGRMPDMWIDRVVTVLRDLNIDPADALLLSKKDFKECVAQRCLAVYTQELEVARRESTVLARYSTHLRDARAVGVQLKQVQPWLRVAAGTRGLQLVQQLRAGSLPLRTLTGRFASRHYVQGDPAARQCPCCESTQEETFVHFLLECPAYEVHRFHANLLLKAGAGPDDIHPAFEAEPTEAAAFHLLDFARMGSKLHTVVAPFVYDCWQHRCAVLDGRQPVCVPESDDAAQWVEMCSIVSRVHALAPVGRDAQASSVDAVEPVVEGGRAMSMEALLRSGPGTRLDAARWFSQALALGSAGAVGVAQAAPYADIRLMPRVSLAAAGAVVAAAAAQSGVVDGGAPRTTRVLPDPLVERGVEGLMPVTE